MTSLRLEKGGQAELSLTQILASLSYALDLTGGQPMGHAQRTCVIGMKLAEVIGLSDADRKSLCPALLIKDAGCSTNAARMFEVFGGNEITAKRLTKITDWSNLAEAAKYAFNNTLPGKPLLNKVAKLLNFAKDPGVGNQMIQSRCTRGADIARRIGLTEEGAAAILALDEHWDGNGSPYKLKGDQIPLFGRIACLAQTLEVYAKTFDIDTAYEVVRKRSSKWFDPELVRASESFSEDTAFWRGVYELGTDVLAGITDNGVAMLATELRIDSICDAFAEIVDAKSPFTAEHSTRVSGYTVEIAKTLGINGDRLTLLRRASLLHDIGKLAVPNSILDSPGRPSDEDWAVIKKHPLYTYQILTHIPGFERMAEVAAAHHERLDGRGYFRGTTGENLDTDMRVIAVADVFDALSAKRPYRDALPLDEVFKIIDKDSGVALCPTCVEALHLSQNQAMPKIDTPMRKAA